MHFLKTLLFASSAVVAAPGSPPGAVDVSRRSSILETRNACGVDGVVNGQCGELWDFNDCTGHIVEHIKPDCSQTCFKVDEGKAVSVRAMGDGTYGTACYLYEDDNCKNEISHTSLGITATDKKCASTKDDRKIRSWKCTFKCHT